MIDSDVDNEGVVEPEPPFESIPVIDGLEVDDSLEEDTVRPAWKPDVSGLPDAVQLIDGIPTFVLSVGDRIVIDYSGLKYGAWLDTRCWVIESAADSGFVGLYDPQQRQKGCTDWRLAAGKGVLLKVPGKKDVFVSVSDTMSRKGARRAIARELKAETKAAGDAVLRALPSGNKTSGNKKKGKGRPKGTINSSTRSRLIAAGYVPENMQRQEIVEAMAKIRKEAYDVVRDRLANGKRGMVTR